MGRTGHRRPFGGLEFARAGRTGSLRLPRLLERKLVPKWLPVRWLAIKYMMDVRTCRKWIAGQGKDCYRLQVIKTPAGLRILDPQLELPPYRTAEPDEMFIYRASEIAALAGVTRQWVNRLANQNRLRFRCYGRARFFPLSEARRLLKARGKLPESDKKSSNPSQGIVRPCCRIHSLKSILRRSHGAESE